MLPNVRLRLSLMMFLQFFIWGAWYVTMGTYLANALKADGVQIGAAYSAMAIATIISPFFVGMIADRFFSAEKLLGVLHIAGAVVLYFLTSVTDANTFYWWVLLYSLLYAPTLALSNSVAFGQMKDPGQSFAGIRVFGTIGWIVAGVFIDRVFHIEASQMAFTFKMAAIASGILGVLSFLLPTTPPKAKGQKATFAQILGSDAFVLFKDKSFVTFFLASILICIPLSFYYSQANQFLNEVGMANATSNMTIGQFSEALFILLIPVLFRKLGVKWMIMIGMLAWVLRFLCFSYGNADTALWMLFGGIILHGVCYDFFFVTGQIYTDNKAGDNIKSSAQGMITMATYGLGMWIGSLLSGYFAKQYTIGENIHDWRSIWLIPAGISGVVLILFAVFFTDKKLKTVA
ncbi:MAG: nucleoside permease [Deinococcales bacterium]|nr:nucleoside permease [Chitinophagaceae bacterium]